MNVGDKQHLEVGKIYKGVQRIINAIWTCEFIPTRDGIFILNYGSNDDDGYEYERELHQIDLIEDDERTVTGIKISDPKQLSSFDHTNVDKFKVKNPKFIFSYNVPPTFDELSNDPDLKHLRSKFISKDFGIGESKLYLKAMKHVMSFNQFINENYISLEQFKEIPIGTKVVYQGFGYVVEVNNGVSLDLKSEKTGKITKVNYSMFNQHGIISNSTSDKISN